MDLLDKEIRILVDHEENIWSEDTPDQKSQVTQTVLTKSLGLDEVPLYLKVKVDSQFGI